MQERRTTIRVHRFSRAHYCPSDDLVPRDGRLIDLSERGAGLLAQESRRSGERVTVSFTLPEEDEPLTATGIVRWSNAHTHQGRWYPLGLEWLPLEETARHRLHAFLGSSWQTSAPRQRALNVRPRLRAIRTFVLGATIVCGALVAVSFVRWAKVLQQENRQLGEAIQRRNELITHLAQRGAHLEQELTVSKTQLAVAAEAMSHLGSQANDLEGNVQRLTQEVERFQQSYVQVREERNQLVGQRDQLLEERGRLIKQVLDLEQERTLLTRRLESIPDLRLAIREAIEARKAAQRLAWLQARQQASAQQVVEGNRGYLIWEGQPTSGRPTLQIKVHEPETLPSSP